MAVEYAGIEFTRPGHASVRIETPATVVYIDPWSDVVDGAPGDADVVVVTHDDYDHYDPDGIRAVSGEETTVVVYEPVDTTALGRRVTRLDLGRQVDLDGVTIRAVPAYNRVDGDHVDEEGNPYHAKGSVMGVLLEFDGTTVLFPSDTDFLDSHLELTADVVMPPIGGHYTMDRHEAADLSEVVGAALVLPVHYDTFEAIETDAAAFESDVEARGIQVELF